MIKDEKEREENMLSFEKSVILPNAIEFIKMDDIHILIKIKNFFRSQSKKTMSNILRICLSKEEEKLACIITAYYDFYLEAKIVTHALKDEQYEFLRYVWAFDKNYIDEVLITFEDLFGMIKQHYGENKDAAKT